MGTTCSKFVPRKGSRGPGSDKKMFLTIRATGHKQAREYISGKSFTGGRKGRERGRGGERGRERMGQYYGKV